MLLILENVIPEKLRMLTGRVRKLRFDVLRQYGSCARQADRSQDCISAVQGIKTFNTDTCNVHHWQLEMARNLWSQGEERRALQVAQTVKQLLDIGDNSHVAADALFLLGQWSVSTRSEGASRIIDTYLLPAVKKFDSLDLHKEKTGACLTLARFADDQYRLVVRKEKETDKLLKTTHAELAELRDLKHHTKPTNKRLGQLAGRMKWQEEDKARMKREISDMLEHAAKNYLLCLQESDDHDLQIFRVCNLWFSNDRSDVLYKHLNKAELGPHKWLPLMRQLASKLEVARNAGGPFPVTLEKIIISIVKTHPHHSIFVLIALKNGDNTKQSGLASLAEEMLSRLGSENNSLSALINQMDELSIAYEDLADLPIKSKNKLSVDINKFKGKFKLANLDKKMKIDLSSVAVVTQNIPIDRSGQYDTIVGISHFDDLFSTAGGINLPKIINCHGNDGRKYKSLVKGNDDVRQDALIQQVFELANAWFAHDAESHRRMLRVRTYKVIPLSPKSGVLEWCTGTMPLSGYLTTGFETSTGKKAGAHERYANVYGQKKAGLTHANCRSYMNSIRKKELSEKVLKFRDICENFPPVMRYFFIEHFPQPAQWFERRLAYTRSVATCSMVGYILGIGDRHPSNLLIDTASAELVHIDLGIAFDQGKEMPTPETVPFRLTRDIVDGMGVCGVDGVFRRCCEHALRVLRQSEASLLTVLEVFLNDPLVSWTLTEAQIDHAQGDEAEDAVDNANADSLFAQQGQTSLPARSSSRQSSFEDSATDSGTKQKNEEAARILDGVRGKLAGESKASRLSVTGHVNQLIREATDDENLCRVFPGWQPWC